MRLGTALSWMGAIALAACSSSSSGDGTPGMTGRDAATDAEVTNEAGGSEAGMTGGDAETKSDDSGTVGSEAGTKGAEAGADGGGDAGELQKDVCSQTAFGGQSDAAGECPSDCTGAGGHWTGGWTCGDTSSGCMWSCVCSCLIP